MWRYFGEGADDFGVARVVAHLLRCAPVADAWAAILCGGPVKELMVRGVIFMKAELEKKVGRALSLIPGMDDGQLIRTAAYARHLESYAFLLRGACASEMRKRAGVRLAGGRG